MARPIKETIDYFPHFAVPRKTIFILESQYGNDGYAFWFKLLEVLCQRNNMLFDYKDRADVEYLLAKVKVDEDLCLRILDTLANVDAIDKFLWQRDRIIWSQNLANNVKDAFRKRKSPAPEKPVVDDTNLVSGDGNPVQAELIPPLSPKLNEIKLNETIIPFVEIIDYLNEQSGKRFSHSNKETKKMISGRWSEGHRLEQFQHVIDVKVAEWTGTEQEQYIRPNTLFRPSNFESYLNQKRGAKKNGKGIQENGRLAEYGEGERDYNRYPSTGGQTGWIRPRGQSDSDQERTVHDDSDLL